MDEEFCPNCQRQIAAANFVIHAAHCQRFIEICDQCSEPFPKKELREHFDAYHVDVECEKCQKIMQKWELPDHESDQCSKRPMACLYCELEVPWDDIKSHEDYCGSRTEACKHCKKYVTIKDKEFHAKFCPLRKDVDNNVGLKEYLQCKICEVDIPLKLVEVHEEYCGKKTEICPYCKKKISRRERPMHIEAVCLNDNFADEDMGLDVPAACRYCKLKIPLKDIKQHEDMCGSATKTCGHCKKDVRVKEQELHYKMCLEETLASAWVDWKVSTKQDVRDLKLRKREIGEGSQTSKMTESEESYANQLNLKGNKRMIPCAYCETEFPEDLINEHEGSCEAQTETCPYCQKVYPMDGKAIHRNECQKQKFVYNENDSKTRVDCKFCGKKSFWMDVALHESLCPKRTEACEICKKDIIVVNMKRHISECINALSSYAVGDNILSSSLEKITNDLSSMEPTGKRKADLDMGVIESQFGQLSVKVRTEKGDRKIIAAKSPIPKCVKQLDATEFENMQRGIGRGRGRICINENPLKSATGIETGARRKKTLDDLDFDLCPKCNDHHPSIYIEEHLIKCQGPATCKYCMEKMRPLEKQNHLQVCPARQGAWQGADKPFGKQLADKKNNQVTPDHRRAHRQEEPILLPCEFCSTLFPFDKLIEHQSGCRPDLLHFPGQHALKKGNDDLPDMISESKIASNRNEKNLSEKRKSTKAISVPFQSEYQSKRGRPVSNNYHSGRTASAGEFLFPTHYAGYPGCYNIYDVNPQAFEFANAQKNNSISQRRNNSQHNDGKLSADNFNSSYKRENTEKTCVQTSTGSDTLDIAADSSGDEFMPCRDFPEQTTNVEVTVESIVISSKKDGNSSDSSKKSSPMKKQISKKKQKKKSKKKSWH